MEERLIVPSLKLNRQNSILKRSIKRALIKRNKLIPKMKKDLYRKNESSYCL